MTKLTDEQMRDFIRNGFVAVKTGLPREFHQEVWDQTEALFEEDGNPGNNLMARIPDVRKVFDDPAVDGALAGVLGDNYFMHPHRHCHYRPPHSEGQKIHRDSFTRRRHRTRWLLTMYYPQDTTVDMGPTGVVPGSHYYNQLTGPIGIKKLEGGKGEVAMAVEAGTVLIVHYDLWHRGMGNESDKKRYMMKFLFARIEEPAAPSWESDGGDWVAGDDHSHNVIWDHMWRWYSGAAKNGSPAANGNGSIPGHIADLGADAEGTRLEAAYHLASIGEAAIPALIDTLGHESEMVRRNASYALTAIGAAAVPALIDASRAECGDTRSMAVETLADTSLAGAEAVPALAQASTDASVEVRRHAADGLGIAGQRSADGVPALIDALGDPDEILRRNACLALARIGAPADAATPALARALNDENRYVRGKAAHALRRIGTTQATDALLQFLLTSQYCYSTTKDSLY